jgi:hypothetical protein
MTRDAVKEPKKAPSSPDDEALPQVLDAMQSHETAELRRCVVDMINGGGGARHEEEEEDGEKDVNLFLHLTLLSPPFPARKTATRCVHDRPYHHDRSPPWLPEWAFPTSSMSLGPIRSSGKTWSTCPVSKAAFGIP